MVFCMGFYNLQGAALITYLERLRALVTAARLCGYSPERERLLGALHLWEPLLAPRRNATLPIDEESELPAESAFTRLLNERKLYLRERNAGRCSLRKLNSPWYGLLEHLPFPERFSLRLHLRSLDASRRRARFRAILDRFDLSEGVLARYVINFTSVDSLWEPSLVLHEKTIKRVTEPFRNLISSACQDEAELAFITLSAAPGLTIESLVRGRIGPLFREGKPMPPPVAEIMKSEPGALVLNLPLDGVFTDLARDMNLDPFANLYRSTLSEETARQLEAVAQRFSMRVLKERRVVAWTPRSNKDEFIQKLNNIGGYLMVTAA